MSRSNIEKLCSYYQSKEILPTYARFLSREDLDKYKRQRSNFFLEKLYLPSQMFKGASLVEFGPDSGENALVFADWGAQVNLVEPNPNAWPRIVDNFDKFGLREKIKSLAKIGLEDFKTKEKFRFIVAEGFIYTIRPESIWIELFSKILADDGFFIISYGEAYGELIELFLKLIYSRVKAITGLSSTEAAGKLFRAKWDSIPHTRTFESWVMDVIDSPFARSKYFFNARQLYMQLSQAGFSLYSSWPIYTDGLDVYWHKKEISSADKLEKSLKFIARSSLSFAFGRKLFLCSEDERVEVANKVLSDLIELLDQSIDKFDTDILTKCCYSLESINKILIEEFVLSDSPKDIEDTSRLIESLLKILNMLLKGDVTDLVSFCNSDSAFINSWGQPCHYAVFKKDE